MHMFDKVKDKAEEAVGAGQEQFGRATDDGKTQFEGAVRKNLSQASYAVNDAVDTVKRTTSDNPVPALLVAAGVGFVLAKLLGGRR
ncbi:CsbD family protein [Chimaeribacter arupi]|uniref:CsbD family protein n=3 Tax=Enterobacterales TaxID=91347 RepID=A0A2N5ETF2_9GAMM|nr:CsbD family protein [Nissabacter archeti]PLR39902.1 CsbD family protein [Chimaeribacter arupi]PLR49084.1 CsbD family protein [Chimaeribacter arupi]PLR53387.1 CsbD family protein [Chimaeribacter arupi]PLR54153.1 CsbD family protein [Chimaeribacter arupi]